MTKHQRFLIWATVLGLAFKLALFGIAETYAPQMKFEPDTPWYLQPAFVMAEEGVFARYGPDGQLIYGIFRTPGYPAYLALFHVIMEVPLAGIILSQILLTVAAAWVVYFTAIKFAKRLPSSVRPGFVQEWLPKLSYVIVLFDPSTAVYSMMIMSEALFTLLVAGFLYFAITYLEKKTWLPVFLSGLCLCGATFARPISYYLGVAVAVFFFVVMVKANWKKAIAHTLIFILAAYTGVGAWTVRNHHRTGDMVFSSSAKNNLNAFGLAGSYHRNEDPYSKNLPAWAYYANVSSRCFMSLMTRPVNFKYFKAKPVKIFGKIITYPWVIFWLIGFFYGAMKMDVKNPQHMFVAMCFWYFVCASIGGVSWYVGPRFRMPMMPFIALFAAYGWGRLVSYWHVKLSKLSK